MTPIVFLVAVRTRNPLNGGFGATKQIAAIRSRERADQRAKAKRCTIDALALAGVHQTELLPVDVLLTRLSAGVMDDDGLAASQKGVRDGIAEALGVDDGSSFIRFRYAQEKAKPKTFGVRVSIAKRGAVVDRDTKPENVVVQRADAPQTRRQNRKWVDDQTSLPFGKR